MSAEEHLRQIHRAMHDHDNDAWQTIYRTYTAYISSWINRTDSTRMLSQQDRSDLVQDTFSKLFQAGKTRCLHFPELAAFYTYLRQCVRSVTLDTMTSQDSRQQSLETCAEVTSATDPAVLVIEAESVQAFTRLIVAQAQTEQERIIILSWLNDVPSEVILQQYSQVFPDARLLHYVQKSLRSRLARCLGAGAGEPTREKNRQSAVEVQATGSVIYHQQRSFCGKMRCHRCRTGTGHGPYWYAYSLKNGCTVRRYIGKTLPEEVQREEERDG